MDPRNVASWILNGAAADGLAGTASAHKPPLQEAYAVYLGLFAPLRASSAVVGPGADFVEVLRQNEKDTLYTDEEWIAFLLPFTGDRDKARDLWDALLCQPSFAGNNGW